MMKSFSFCTNKIKKYTHALPYTVSFRFARPEPDNRSEWITLGICPTTDVLRDLILATFVFEPLFVLAASFVSKQCCKRLTARYLQALFISKMFR